MKEILELLSPLIFHDRSSLIPSKSPTFIRLAANLAAFSCLVFGYIVGCRALYHYLKPDWGEEVSLLAVCGLLLVTSFILFIISWLLKPKKSQPTNLLSEIEKTISEIPSHEIIKKAASMISPKAVIAVFAFATMASYLSSFKKKDV